MIIQQLSFEIIDGMREIDSNAQIDMIQTYGPGAAGAGGNAYPPG
jgi:hypothetical protein